MQDMGSHGWQIGPLFLPATVLTTWGIIAVLTLAGIGITRRLVDTPGLVQTAVEGILIAMEHAIAAVLPDQARTLLPFLGTLWTFLAVANLAGLIPGLHSPTADLSVTAALAVLVYLSVHWFGIRQAGLKAYLRHYVSPNPVLLPFHLLGELTRTVALAVRLFGNIMSLEIAALIMLLAAGFLVPVPILMLHIIEALVQAYIFGMLALMYIASGMHVQQQREPSQNPTPSE
jgi:F-type H+-transporting ATPase subunit a